MFFSWYRSEKGKRLITGEQLRGLLLVLLKRFSHPFSVHIFEIQGTKAEFLRRIDSREDLQHFLRGYRRIIDLEVLIGDEISGIYQPALGEKDETVSNASASHSDTSLE